MKDCDMQQYLYLFIYLKKNMLRKMLVGERVCKRLLWGKQRKIFLKNCCHNCLNIFSSIVNIFNLYVTLYIFCLSPKCKIHLCKLDILHLTD